MLIGELEKVQAIVSVPVKGSFVVNEKAATKATKTKKVSVPVKGSFVVNSERKEGYYEGSVSVPVKGSFVVNSDVKVINEQRAFPSP